LGSSIAHPDGFNSGTVQFASPHRSKITERKTAEGKTFRSLTLRALSDEGRARRRGDGGNLTCTIVMRTNLRIGKMRSAQPSEEIPAFLQTHQKLLGDLLRDSSTKSITKRRLWKIELLPFRFLYEPEFPRAAFRGWALDRNGWRRTSHGPQRIEFTDGPDLRKQLSENVQGFCFFIR